MMNVKQRKAEKNKEELRKLSMKEGNKFCFDCGMRGPLYAVTKYSIFVCSTCAAVHRSLQHSVKGISMSEFSDDEVIGIAAGGNDRAAKVWLSRFMGRRPASGNDRSIRDFLVDTFEREAYIDREEHTRWQEAIAAAKNPTAARPAGAVPSVHSPPPSAPPRQTATPSQGPPPTATTAASPPVAPAHHNEEDVFDDFFVAQPAPAAAQASNAHPSAPPAPATTASVVDDLFSGFSGAPAVAPGQGSGPVAAQPMATPGMTSMDGHYGNHGNAYMPQQQQQSNTMPVNFFANPAPPTGPMVMGMGGDYGSFQSQQQQQQYPYQQQQPPLGSVPQGGGMSGSFPPSQPSAMGSGYGGNAQGNYYNSSPPMQNFSPPYQPMAGGYGGQQPPQQQQPSPQPYYQQPQQGQMSPPQSAYPQQQPYGVAPPRGQSKIVVLGVTPGPMGAGGGMPPPGTGNSPAGNYYGAPASQPWGTPQPAQPSPQEPPRDDKAFASLNPFQ